MIAARPSPPTPLQARLPPVWLHRGQRLFNVARALGALPGEALQVAQAVLARALAEGESTEAALLLRAAHHVRALRPGAAGPFAQLSADERFAFVLVDGAQLPVEQVAAVLELEVDAVAAHVHRARMALAK